MIKSTLLYIFRRPVKESIQNSLINKEPHDIFYGLTKINKFHIDYTDKIVSNKILLFLQKYFNHFVSLFYDGGFSLITSLFFLPILNKYKLIFATVDTYGLPLALLKKMRLIKPKIILNTIGLYDAIINRNNPLTIYIIKSLSQQFDHIVSGGSFQECKKISRLLNIPITNFSFIPFGIDTEFFYPKNDVIKYDVLTIGADPSRDWKLIIKIAKKLPNIKFHIITLKGLFPKDRTKNISIEYDLNYIQIRQKIWQAKIILIPSKFNYHFAGQSTIMRCMASGKTVIFTNTPGVSEYKFKNYINCILVPPNNLKLIEKGINYLNKYVKKRLNMGKLARTLIKKEYNINLYATTLQKLFDRYY